MGRRELPAGLEATVVELRLTSGIQVRGSVEDARTGRPVAGAALTVRVADEPETEHLHVRSGPSGDFVLEVAEGPFTLVAEAPSYARLITQSRAPTTGPLVLRLGPSAFLTGHVLDAQGRPAPGATVTALGRAGPLSELTDARGAYSVEVPPGTHLLTGRLGTAAAALEHPVAVIAGQTRTGLDLRLGASGTFSGRLTGDGRPVPGVAVLLSPRGMRGDSGRATSDADGRWEIGALPQGTYDLDTVAEGWSSEQRLGLRLLAGQRFVVDLQLRSAANVVGVVRDRQGPVGGAGVTAGTARTQTDDLGRFRLEGLTAGDVTLVARRWGSTIGATRTIALAPAATAEVNLDLPGEGTVEGRVTTREGQPAPRTMLGFVRLPDGRGTAVKSDDDGHYTVNLEEGRYQASPMGQMAQAGNAARYVSVANGGVERVDLVVDPTSSTDAALTGVVVEPDGTPSAGALVTATGHNVRSTVPADESGHFAVAFVPDHLQAIQGAKFGEREVKPGEREVTLRLGGTMSLHGRVIGTPPPSGFRLNVYPAGGSWSEAETVTFDGSTFELADVRPGSVVAMARTNDGRIGFATTRVPEGGTGNVDVTVEGACGIVGRVSAPADSMGRTEATATNADDVWRRVDVSADGSFRIDGLPKGAYELTARKGPWSAHRSVILDERCPVEVGTLSLGPPAVPPGEVGVFTSSGSPVLRGVLPGSPAQVAGLLAGDEILSVGGSLLRPGEDLGLRLTGEPGTPVTVTYRRSAVTYTVVLVRAP